MVDQLMVVLYLVAVLWIGLWQGRGIRTLHTYAVAGRNYPAWIIFATLSATFIGGGFSMGNAEKCFRYGIANIVALWGFSLQQLFVSVRIAPRIGRYTDCISVGDIMGMHYGKIAKVFTGLFAFILCAGILGAQVGAMGYIFNVLLHVPRIWGIAIGFGIVIIYDTAGGMRSVVATDILQFVFLAIGMPLALVIGAERTGGFMHLFDALPAGHLSIPGVHFTWLGFLSLFLTFVVGETLVPPYVQRLLLSKNVQTTVRGNFWSGIYSIPFFVITGLIGFVALHLNAGINPNLAMPYVIQEVLPIGIRGLVIAAIIAIAMSSADSFMNAAVVSIVNDVLRPLRSRPPDERRDLILARFINVALGALAIAFAVKIPSVLDILIYAYNFWAPMILVPLVSALVGVDVKPRHFYAGSFGGVLGVLGWKVVLGNPYGVDGLVVGVLANLALFYAAYLWDRVTAAAPEKVST